MFRFFVLMIALVLAQSVASAQYAKTFPREIIPLESAICRVSTRDKDGTESIGTGTLIAGPSPTYAGREYVVTAYHVVRDASSVRVSWDGITLYPARVVAARPSCDVCLLAPKGVPDAIPRVDLASADVRLGETVYIFGFGGVTAPRADLRGTGGPVYQFTSNSYGDEVWLNAQAKTRDGDSGGPIFVVRDRKPVLVGVAWGCGPDGDRDCYFVAGTRLVATLRLFGVGSATSRPAPVSRQYQNQFQPVRRVIQAASS